MTFKFKISRRLSENAVFPFALMLVAAVGCSQNPGVVNPSTALPSPNPVNDLAVTSQTDTSVTLSFTEVGDGMGNPANYELRYSVGPMNWDSATTVTDGSCAAPILGTTIGATRTCTTQGLTANTDYTFQLMSFSPTDTSTTSTSTHGKGNGKGSNQAHGKTTNGTKIAKVSISPTSVTDTVGQSTKLAATVTDNHGKKMSGVTITWSTSAPSVVAVSDSGVVSALTVGSATVLAVAGTDTGAATVAVTSDTSTTPGTAHVTVSGFASGATSGGSVKLVSSTNSTSTIALSSPSSGTSSGSASVAAQTYTVTYTPPSGYTLASGDSATKTLSVTAGQTTGVSYTVQAVTTTGTATVTVSGFSGTATAAGSVAFTSSNNTTSTVTLPAPTSGSSSVSTTVAAGTYTVTYAPPSGYTLAAGDSATKTLSVTGGLTSTISFTVAAVQTAGGLLFHSDWSTATGTSGTAVTDGGKWTSGSFSSLTTVVTGAENPFSALFPDAFRAELTANNGAHANVNGLGVPAVGQSQFWRFYLYVDYPNTEPTNGNGGNHGFSTNGGGISIPDLLWELHWGHTQGSNDLPNFGIWTYEGQPNTNTHHYELPPGSLSQRTIYRIEIETTRTATTTYSLDIRVYSQSGTLLFTGADFLDTKTPHNAVSAVSHTVSSTPSYGQMAVGQNGITNWTWGAGPLYHYVGAVCIRSDTWCGPYKNGI